MTVEATPPCEYVDTHVRINVRTYICVHLHASWCGASFGNFLKMLSHPLSKEVYFVVLLTWGRGQPLTESLVTYSIHMYVGEWNKL